MRTVLATDLGIWPLFKDLHKVSDFMVNSREVKRSLANYILLYNQIYIPTGNLQILPVLRIILGEDIFDELVKNNVIVLARYDKWFSYYGNGSGLSFFSISSGQDKNNLFHSYFAPLDECIETALSTTKPVSNSVRKQELTNLLLDNVIPVVENIDHKTFKNETYKDISESPYLRDFLSYKNRGKSLNNLKGIGANQVRTYAAHNVKDENNSPAISAVLQAAFDNFVLGIGSDLKADEITGDGTSLALLKAKGQRVGMPIEGQEAFAKIQDITNVPDIGLAFADGMITAEQLLDLRESKHAEAFRIWLGESDPQDTHEDIVRRYVETLGKPSIIESIPIKTLRFAATTSISALKPPAGVVAGAIDNFLLSKWFPGKSPRLFLKHAKSVIVKSDNKKEPTPPKMSGRDRNRPCSCGSGKKFKKCCGK